MHFANPWGLLALLALPTIIIIHMYHRRFPPLVVAGLHLWTSETRQTIAGRRREKLPVSASLLLELAAAFLLAVILSEPHYAGMNNAVHLVAVLDNSASMSAQPSGGVSFRDAAINELEQRAKGLPRGSVVTLILTGNRPVMLAGPAVAWDDAKPRLLAWQPQSVRHSFEPAWDLGLQLVEKSGRLLFVTDQLPPDSRAREEGKPAERDLSDRGQVSRQTVPEQMEWVSVGRRLDNLAISAARWAFDAATGKGQIFLRVQNHSRQPMKFNLVGRNAATIVFRRAGQLSEQGASSFEAEVPGGLGRLTVELAAGDDGLAIDNHVELIEPQARIVTLAVSHPQAETVRSIRRVLDALPEVQIGDGATAHLVFAAAGSLPDSNPRRWWAGIGPISTEQESLDAAKDLAGPYLIDKRQPLLEGVLLSGVVWGGVQPITYDVTPLISSGNLALVSQLNGTRSVSYLFNIDLARSNLAESPDWPILIANLVELRRESLPGLARWNYRLGEDVRFRLFEGDAVAETAAAAPELTLVHDGKSKPVARTTVVELPPLDETGVYEVQDGQTVVGRFAVNFFDAEESDLRNLVPGHREAGTQTGNSSVSLENPYSWVSLALLLVLVGCVFGDWFVLRRI
jgi:hypothetical protein